MWFHAMNNDNNAIGHKWSTHISRCQLLSWSKIFGCDASLNHAQLPYLPAMDPLGPLDWKTPMVDGFRAPLGRPSARHPQRTAPEGLQGKTEIQRGSCWMMFIRSKKEVNCVYIMKPFEMLTVWIFLNDFHNCLKHWNHKELIVWNS